MGYRDDDSWLERRLEDLGAAASGAWDSTGGRVVSALGENWRGSPIEQAGDVLAGIGQYSVGPIVDLVAAGTNLPWWMVGKDGPVQNPVGGMDWFAQHAGDKPVPVGPVQGPFLSGPGGDFYEHQLLAAQDAAGLEWDPSTSSWVPKTAPEVEAGVAPNHPSQTVSGPSTDELYALLVAAQRQQANDIYDKVIGGLDAREAALSGLVDQLETLKNKGIRGAGERQRAALDELERTRSARLEADEQAALLRLGELEAARVAQEDRVGQKIRDRGTDLSDDFDDRVQAIRDRLLDRGIEASGRLDEAALRGSGAIGRQSGRQQELTDRLAQIAADEAVGREMDLRGMYGRQRNTLADRLWAARSQANEAESAGLQAVAEAVLQQQIGNELSFGPQRSQAEQLLAQQLGALDVAGAQRDYDAAVQGATAQQIANLLSGLGGAPVPAGMAGALLGTGLADDVLGGLLDTGGKVPFTLANGSEVLIDAETAARLSADALSDAARPRIQATVDGQEMMLTPSEYETLVRAGKVKPG